MWTFSSLGFVQVTPNAYPRGIIDTLCNSSASFSNLAKSAWPTSWYEVNSLSSSVITLLFFSIPAITLSIELSMSLIEILSLLFLAASSAASLSKFCKSAPVKPGVRFARVFKSTSGSNCLFLAWTFKICSLPLTSGALM